MPEIIVIDSDTDDDTELGEDHEIIVIDVDEVEWPSGVGRIAQNVGSYNRNKEDFGLCLCTQVCGIGCANIGSYIICTEQSCNVLEKMQSSISRAPPRLPRRAKERAPAKKLVCWNQIPPVSVDEVTLRHEYLALTRAKSGYGIRAKAFIPANLRVIEYVGVVTLYSKLNKNGDYTMELSDDTSDEHVYIDAGKAGNLSRFINHTCDDKYANMEIVRFRYRNSWRVFIVSKRDILAGETVLMCYRKEVVLKCECPSPNCKSNR